MKKIVQAAYLLFAVIIMTSTMCLADEAGDKKDSLPVPEYPLSEETIDKAIEDVGLSWDAEVAEHAEVLENQTMYELYDEEARMIASLSSYTDEDGRFLMVSFMPPQLERELVTVVEEKDWEAVMLLSEKLYGGLETEEQIYQDFISDFEAEAELVEYEAENGGTPAYAMSKKMIKGYDNINCRIMVGYSDDTETSERYLHTITLYNDEKYMRGGS